MALGRDAIAFLMLAPLASIPVSFGLSRGFWALRADNALSIDGNRGRLYRISERQRRRRFSLLCLFAGIGLAFAAMLLIVLPWGQDNSVRMSCGLGFLLVVGGCAAFVRRWFKRDQSIGLIVDADAITLLLPHGEERLLKSQAIGVHLDEARSIAFEGTSLSWLQQIGQVVIKPRDPKAPALKLPPGLKVDSAFDEWIADLPVLGSPLLEDRGRMTVRAAGDYAKVISRSAQSAYATVGLSCALILMFFGQLFFSGAIEAQGDVFTDASLLALGGARADLAFEAEEWFRLVSAAFLHRDSSHLMRSLPFLLVLGSLLERQVGSISLVAIFLICAAASTSASLYLAPPGFLTVGASGPVLGILGFYFGSHVRPQAVQSSPWALLLLVALFTYLATPSQSWVARFTSNYLGPDYGGNLAGLLTGAMAALALAMIPRRSPRIIEAV